MEISQNNIYQKGYDGLSISDYPVHLFICSEDNKSKTIETTEHSHAEIHCYFVESGKILVHVGEKDVEVSAKQYILINHHTPHYFEFIDEYSVVALLTINTFYIFGYGATSLNSKYITPVLSRDRISHCLLTGSSEWQKEMMSYFQLIIKANESQEFGYELATKSWLCHVWLIVIQLMNFEKISQKMHSTVLPNMRVKNAIVFIENHYAEPITLDEIADSIHVSKSECCRSFKRSISMTPFEYLMKYRIYIATTKIISNDVLAASISGLAASVGFNNPSYFNKVFKEYIGCTPTQFRRDLGSYDVRSLLLPSDSNE